MDQPNSSEQGKTALPLMVIVICCVLVVAAIAGWAAYAVSASNANKHNADLQAQINSLQSQLAAASPSPTITASPQPVSSPSATAASTPTATPQTALTNDQIFQEVASAFGLSRSQLAYFRIFGQDKVQYRINSVTSGTTYAYKDSGTWKLALEGAQSVAACGDLSNVPLTDRPPCSGQSTVNPGTYELLYADSNNKSTNYPPDSAVSYIGQ